MGKGAWVVHALLLTFSSVVRHSLTSVLPANLAIFGCPLKLGSIDADSLSQLTISFSLPSLVYRIHCL